MTEATDALNTDVLSKIINALKPLNSDERHRVVEAAMMFLGEAPVATGRKSLRAGATERSGDGSQSESAMRWMEKYDVSAEDLDQVFHISPDDGSFDIHDVPGKSSKEKTINTYVLTGLGQYLATGNKTFPDSLARGFCETIGCYDAANHAAHLKKYRGPEFSGNKAKGYVLTGAGLKRGAELVKAHAGAAE